MTNSVLTIKFRDYFTDTYRFNADVYAMCNCILYGASKRMELEGDSFNEKYSQLADVLLEEVFLKSTEIIDYEKVCNTLDKLR